MKICIILNGEIKNYDYINSVVVTGSYDYIICSDGGANHAYSMNIVPDYIIGDLDSVNGNIIEYYIYSAVFDNNYRVDSSYHCRE